MFNWSKISKEEVSFQRSTASVQETTPIATSLDRCTHLLELLLKAWSVRCPESFAVLPQHRVERLVIAVSPGTCKHRHPVASTDR